MWAPTAWFAAILAGTDAAGLSQQHMFTTGDPTAENPPRGDGRHASGGSRPRASSWSAPPSTHLGGHHLGVGAADLHARIEASLVVGLHDVTSVHLICSNPTVIRAWGGGRRHQVNKALGKKSHQLGNRELCWSQRIYRNQTALPSTVHRSSDPKSRAQWWCNLSLIYAAQLDWQCMGRRPRDKQSWAGCARRHHPGSLSTSGSRHCSDNSRHCSCLEESAGCGFTGFFLIQPARGRSPPRLGEGRCCKQPVPVPGWVRRVGKPPAPSRRCLGSCTQPVLSPTAVGRFFRPSSPALDKQVVQPRAVCAMGSGSCEPQGSGETVPDLLPPTTETHWRWDGAGMGTPAVGLHSLWAEHLGWGLRKALTLWAGEAVVRPAVGVAIDTQQCVFLLHPKPGVAVLHQVHHLLAGVPQVGLCEQWLQSDPVALSPLSPSHLQVLPTEAPREAVSEFPFMQHFLLTGFLPAGPLHGHRLRRFH